MYRWRTRFSALLGCLLLAITVVGCGNQGEGFNVERSAALEYVSRVNLLQRSQAARPSADDGANTTPTAAPAGSAETATPAPTATALTYGATRPPSTPPPPAAPTQGPTPTVKPEAFVEATSAALVPCADRVPQIDDLLTIVTRQYEISPNYVPRDLVALTDYIDPGLIFTENNQVRAVIIEPLLQMMTDMQAAGLRPTILSAYRSYEKQQVAWDRWVSTYEYGDLLSARPGTSEHHLGTTVDFGSPELNNQFHTRFAQTAEGIWLADNAHRYGFTMSYPSEAFELTEFLFEPWHFRYVGVSLATQLKEQSKTLTEYQLTQLPKPCIPATEPLASQALAKPAPSESFARFGAGVDNPDSAVVAISPLFLQRYPEEQLQILADRVDYTIVVVDDPQAALRSGNADYAVYGPFWGDLPDAYFVNYIPYAITVPWYSETRDITVADAKEAFRGNTNRFALSPASNVPLQHRTVRIEGVHPMDEGYLWGEGWAVVSNLGAEKLSSFVAEFGVTEQPQPMAHLAAVGDIMLDRRLGDEIAAGDIDYPFSQSAAQLQAADYTIGNLESSLGTLGQAVNKGYTFQAPAAAAETLRNAGFDLVALANNHALDFGVEALWEGRRLLAANGVASVGAGDNVREANQPHLANVADMSFAFLSFVNVGQERSGFEVESWAATETEAGLAWGEPDVVAAEVRTLVPKVDHVIVLLHSGDEYQFRPSQMQRELSYAAIDAGATVVIGHHAHVLQGVEFYKDGVILYGLGNFAFDIDGDPTTAIANIWLDSEGVREIAFDPMVIQPGGQPRPATPPEAAAIRDDLMIRSALLQR